MSRDLLAGWQHARVRDASTRLWLDIFHRPGDERCVDALVAYQAGRLSGLKQVPSSDFAQVHCGKLHDDGTVCYFKRFLRRNWTDRLKHFIRPSRARRALLAGLEIESLGFHTPLPVCLLETRRGGIVAESVLVTQEVPNATHIFGWLKWPEWGLVGQSDRKQELIRTFGHEAGRWHAAGLCHGDMGLGNVIATQFSEGFTLYWLDNERTRRFRKLPYRMRLQNLLQVNFNRLEGTRADWLLFWSSYLEACPLAAQIQERLQRDISRQSLPLKTHTKQ